MRNHPRSESAASLRVDLALANDKAAALDRQAREAKLDSESQSERLRSERDAVSELAASLQERLAAEKDSHKRTRGELNEMVRRGQAEATRNTPPSRDKQKERESAEVEVELVRVKGELVEARGREAALSTRVGELLGRIGHVEAEMRGRVEEGEAEGMRRVQAARAEAESLRSQVMRLEEAARVAAQENQEWRSRAEQAEGKSLVSEKRALSVEQDAVELRVEVSRLTGQLARSRVFGGNQDGPAAREVARVLVGELEEAEVVGGGGGGGGRDRNGKKDTERLKGEVMRLEGDLARERIGRRDADAALGAQRVRAEALMDEVASLESGISCATEVQLGAQITNVEAALRRAVAGAMNSRAQSDAVRRELEEENLRMEKEVREARRKAFDVEEQLRTFQTAAEVGNDDDGGATRGTSHERRSGVDENGDLGSDDEDKGGGEGGRSEKERVRQRGVMSALRRGLGRGASPSPRHRMASGRESKSLPR